MFRIIKKRSDLHDLEDKYNFKIFEFNKKVHIVKRLLKALLFNDLRSLRFNNKMLKDNSEFFKDLTGYEVELFKELESIDYNNITEIKEKFNDKISITEVIDYIYKNITNFKLITKFLGSIALNKMQPKTYSDFIKQKGI